NPTPWPSGTGSSRGRPTDERAALSEPRRSDGVARTAQSAWASQGIECGVPATDAELAEFERSHRVCLPDDVREYFLRVNGMARNEWWQWDDDLINFYPLAELIRCEETAGPTAR